MIHHTFAVSNAGTETLVISDVRGTCGCTTAGDFTREIPAGKTGEIPIQINSANMQGMIHKAAIVTSNDKLQPSFTLNMTGEIYMPLEVHPMTAYLRVTSADQTNTSTVIHITNKTGKPVTLSPPEVNNKLFSAELKAVKDGDQFDLTISANGPVPSGPTPCAVTIKTSLADLPVLTVNAVAFAPSPAVVVTPPKITLGPAANSGASMRNILVASTVPQQLQLSDASVNAEGVTVSIKPLQPGRQYYVTLNFPADFKVPSGGMELKIHSNFAQFPIIHVPIEQIPPPPGATAKKD